MRLPFVLIASTMLGCISVQPPAPAHYLDDCVEYLRAGDLERAQAACDLAKEFSPRNADVLNNLGLISMQRGQLDQAQAHFTEAIHSNPDHAAAHSNLGVVFQRRGRLDAAADEYKRALASNPRDVDARFNLGEVQVQQGNPDEGRKTFLTLLEVDPNFADAHHDLCQLDIATEPERAAQECQAAVQIRPHFPRAWLGLARAKRAQGRFCEASEALQECLRQTEEPECRAEIAQDTNNCATSPR